MLIVLNTHLLTKHAEFKIATSAKHIEFSVSIITPKQKSEFFCTNSWVYIEKWAIAI